MSVTFTAENSLLKGWQHVRECAEDDQTLYSSRQAAEAAEAAHEAVCARCRENGSYIWPVESIEPVNFANTNAGRLLHTLGYDTSELVGAADAAEIRRRIEVELTWVGIEGDPETIRRLGQLRQLAIEAIEAGGGKITWG